MTDLEVRFAQYILVNMGGKNRINDHACAACIPGGPMVIDGFLCSYHLAARVISKPRPNTILACKNCGCLTQETAIPCCPDKKMIDAQMLVNDLWRRLYADDGTLAVLKLAEQELATVEREIRGLTPEAQSKALPKIRDLLNAVRS